jgi:hypothetical protein
MIVNRRTFNVKQGRMEEAVALIKAGFEAFPSYTGAYRIYTWSILASAPGDVMVVEFEYEDFEAYQRLWNEWAASPGAEVYYEQSPEIFERGGSSEIWELAASR